jgi:osmotically-inducible protein OsmY
MGERGMEGRDCGRPGQGYGYGTGCGYGAGSLGRGSQRGFAERAGDEVASWFGDDDAARRREADHRGKGPKGYRRSDDRIREDVNDRLSDDPNVDASDIKVMVENGEVTLKGQVSSRQENRHAEDCVERVSGVSHVQNNLRVRV